MLSLLQVLLISSFASVPVIAASSCPPSPCKGGLHASIASALHGFEPACGFCRSKYPIPRQTCTSTAPAKTILTTVSTSITTLTVATRTATVTGLTNTISSTQTITPTVTSITTLTETDTETDTATITATATSITTLTETDTETDTATATITVTAPNQKRAAYGDPRLSKLGSLQRQAPTFVRDVCGCLETPATTIVTFTPTAKSSVTAKSTAIFTAVTTATITPSTTLIITQTAPASTTVLTQSTTTTVTTTITATATATTTSTTTTTTTTTTSTTATATATVVPAPSNGGNKACTNNGSGSEYSGQCGSSSAGCGCYLDVGGYGVCALYYGTCGAACSKDSDCGSGHCLTSSSTTCSAGFCSNGVDSDSCNTSGTSKRSSFAFAKEKAQKRQDMEGKPNRLTPPETS